MLIGLVATLDGSWFGWRGDTGSGDGSSSQFSCYWYGSGNGNGWGDGVSIIDDPNKGKQGYDEDFDYTEYPLDYNTGR